MRARASSSWGPQSQRRLLQGVAGQALGVDPDEHVLLALDGSLDQGQVLLAVQQRLVGIGGEVAPAGDRGLGDPLDQLLALAPVPDQVGDGDERQAVGGGEPLQLGQAGHLALVVDDLAQHRRRAPPAMWARSTAASVWPACLRTPSSR